MRASKFNLIHGEGNASKSFDAFAMRKLKRADGDLRGCENKVGAGTPFDGNPSYSKEAGRGHSSMTS